MLARGIRFRFRFWVVVVLRGRSPVVLRCDKCDYPFTTPYKPEHSKRLHERSCFLATEKEWEDWQST